MFIFMSLILSMFPFIFVFGILSGKGFPISRSFSSNIYIVLLFYPYFFFFIRINSTWNLFWWNLLSTSIFVIFSVESSTTCWNTLPTDFWYVLSHKFPSTLSLSKSLFIGWFLHWVKKHFIFQSISVVS